MNPMQPLRSRNQTGTPDDSVNQWGVDGILAAIDRGSIAHWRRIAAAVSADPFGPVAADLTEALERAEDAGVIATLQQVLSKAREGAEAVAREEVQRRLQSFIADSGMTAAQFAQRLGTSTARLSTYLTGRAVPSATVLVLAEDVSSRAARAGEGTRPGQR